MSRGVGIPIELIERRIYVVRDKKIMVDGHLAELYRVTTGNLNLAVRRNLDRFPEDFMFQLDSDEADSLLLESGKPKTNRGGRRTLPYAFTEHGVAMLSSVLKSERAVQMNILIVRAFVRMREILAEHKDLAGRIEKLEACQEEHTSVIGILASEIDEMRLLPESPKRQIGFSA